jgi:hemolysin activation/secretion protein
MHRKKLIKIIGFLVLTIAGYTALAQTIPDAGSLLREAERQQPRLPTPAPQAVPQAPATPEQSAVRVQVKGFRFSGNTLMTEPELQALLAPWVGKESSFTELQQAINAIAEAYRARGGFARPQLPAQDVSSGIIQINIIEGRLGAVRIDDGGQTLRVDRAMVTDTMTARQKSGDLLSLSALDRSTAILNDTPGVAVATILATGQQPGQTDAVVKVQDKPLFSGTAMLDNQGGRATGSDRLSASLNIDNPRGVGDQIALSGNVSEGNDYLKLAYSLPLGRDGARAGLNTSAMHYKLLGELAVLQAKGDAHTFGLNASYPLLRSGSQNINLAGALDRKNYYNEAASIATSNKQVDVLTLALSGDRIDALGQGGYTLWGINLTSGRLDLSGNATAQNADQIGPQAEGSYHKLGYNIARLQRLSDKTTLWASISGQFANKNLDSSEKLSLGGPSGVRAYPVNEGSGDDGWLATLEVRHNLAPELQASAFYDHGSIKQSHDANYTGAPVVNDATLKGFGVGLSWSQSGNFVIRASLARRVGDNSLASALNGTDGDGSLRLNRFWLSALKFF